MTTYTYVHDITAAALTEDQYNVASVRLRDKKGNVVELYIKPLSPEEKEKVTAALLSLFPPKTKSRKIRKVIP